MKRKLFLIAAFMLVACGDSGSPLPAIEESSSSDIPVSSAKIQSSSSAMALPASSSDIAMPESSSATDITESSSSELASDTVWNKANLTWYTSWPEPGSEECEDQTEEWVSEHNIIAIHEKDWDTYKLKTFRLRKNGHTIDAVVYDMCSDSDCDGCCTENAGKVGFLIDIESYTKARFNNYGSGTVEWTCLDCE